MDTSTRFRECCHFAHTFYSHLDSQTSESLGAKIFSRESVVWENAIQQTVKPSAARNSKSYLSFMRCVFISDLSVKSPERWLLARPQYHLPNGEARDHKYKSLLASVKESEVGDITSEPKLSSNLQWRKWCVPNKENAIGKNENVVFTLHTHHSRAR